MIFLLLLALCAAGTLLALRLDPLATRLADLFATGSALGLAIFAAYGFLAGWAFGLTATTSLLAAIAAGATCIALGSSPAAIRERTIQRPGVARSLVVLVAVVIAGCLADRALVVTEENGIATGDKHNLGDLPFHMAIAAGFAYGDNFPPEHPEFAGASLTYPFFCDLVSGMILSLGGSWREAFVLPTFFLLLAVAAALARFGEVVTGSRHGGRLAAFLTLCSGGLGFLRFAGSGAEGGAAFTTWFSDGLSEDLTVGDREGFRYANFVTTLFIPQRAILFGWPLLFTALSLLVEAVRTTRRDEPSAESSGLWVRAGIVGSLLPLVHSHSFAVLVFCAMTYLALADPRRILSFSKGLAPLALPAIIYMSVHNSISTGRFFEWQPGFDGGAAHPLLFWYRNAGPFLVLAMVGIAGAARTRGHMGICLPFAALFIGANLFRLSPWIWDNMKFLAPAHAGLAAFAAAALLRAFHGGVLSRASGAILLVAATLSGALDIARVGALRAHVDVFSGRDLEYAMRVRAATPASTTILTAPRYNHPALLSGRRLFYGYEGHLWSQGLSFEGRRGILRTIFEGNVNDARTATPRIGAIAWTPAEWELASDRSVFDSLPTWFDSPYRLLRIE